LRAFFFFYFFNSIKNQLVLFDLKNVLNENPFFVNPGIVAIDWVNSNSFLPISKERLEEKKNWE